MRRLSRNRLPIFEQADLSDALAFNQALTGQIVTLDFGWCVPHKNPKVSQQNFLLGHLVPELQQVLI